MNERDREAADDWMRDHLPDAAECSLEDSEEAGSTESYFFLRLHDSATVVYKVAVEDGKVTSVVSVRLRAIRRVRERHARSRGNAIVAAG